MDNLKKEKAIEILREKAAVLGRLPKRADFTQEELFCVKSVFGPLPRALEVAGLKEKSVQRTEKLKRRKQKRKKAVEKRKINAE